MKKVFIAIVATVLAGPITGEVPKMSRQSRMDIVQSYAEALYWDGAYTKAVEEYVILLTEYADLLNPGRRADIMLSLARAYSKAGRLEEATATYHKLLDQELDNRQVLIEMARLKREREGTARAAPYYQRVVTILEGLQAVKALNTEEILALSEAYMACSQPEKAAYACRRWLSRHPQHAGVLRQYAHALIELNKLAKAEKSLRQLVELKDNRSSDKVDLAHVLWIDGNRAEAEKLYEEVIRENPDDRMATDRYASDLMSIKAYDRAIAVIQAYTERHPQDLEMQRKLAQLLSWDGEHDRSLEIYRQLIYR